MRIILGILMFSLLVSCQVFAASSSCPKKDLRTFTIDGIYGGWIDADIDGGDWHMVKLLVGGTERYYIADKADADKYLGTKVGAYVEAVVTTRQIPYDGSCDPMDFLTGGRVLEQAQQQAPVANDWDINAFMKDKKYAGMVFHPCQGPNNTCSKPEQAYMDGADQLTLRKGGHGDISMANPMGMYFERVSITWSVTSNGNIVIKLPEEIGKQTLRFSAANSTLTDVDDKSFVYKSYYHLSK